MKITIPVASLHLGGGCRVLARTANGLHKRGHEVEVVIPKGQPIDYPLLCKVTRVPALEAKYIPNADVILPNYYTTVMPSFQASPWKCVRLSLGFEPLWSNDKNGTLETYLLPIPILSISRWHHDQILTQTGKESTIVSPGIDFSLFNRHASPKVNSAKKRILFLARDPKQNYDFKGVKDFELAMRLVQQRTKIPFEIHLLCPEGKHNLTGLPVKIFDRSNDKIMAKRYRDSDIFVSASWFDSFGYPVLEAMACGTSVVTTNSGGVREFAINNKTCLMVPPQNPEALAKAILTVMKEGETKKFKDMRKLAVQKAKDFTWKRYFIQLEKALQQICQSRPLAIHPAFLESVHVRNNEYGRMMAKMEQIPHTLDLPGDQSFPQIIRKGANNYLKKPSIQTVSVVEIKKQIMDSLRKKTGFSFISLGDTECAFLGINRHVVEPYIKLPNQGFINAGYDPSRVQAERKQLLTAIRTATVVGIPLFRHGLIQKPLMHCLSIEGFELDNIHWGDSTSTYKMMVNGALKRILKEGSPTVLCIGNEANRLATFLKSRGVKATAVISPVHGIKDVPYVINRASKITYDIALVAAGAASIPISSRLARDQQKIALDIGKVADEWVTGITTFTGTKNYNKTANYGALSKHQKSFSLNFQSGYQQGINELFPDDMPLPIGSLPHHWIRNYVLNNLNTEKQILPITKKTTIKNPIWLKQQLEDAFKQSKPLSIINLDNRKLSKLMIPHYASDKQIKNCLKQIDILGIPYLDEPEKAKKILLEKSILPRHGWIDGNSIQQLQFDYLGRFLPTWLKNKRLLLVMKNPMPISTFLRSKGYPVWGTIDSSAGREHVLPVLKGIKQFDIALVSADIDTLIYSQFIAAKMGKISLDIGDMLHDARRNCVNVAMWTNQQIHKMD